MQLTSTFLKTYLNKKVRWFLNNKQVEDYYYLFIIIIIIIIIIILRNIINIS